MTTRTEQQEHQLARAFNKGVIAQREATRAAGRDVGRIVAENPYHQPGQDSEEQRELHHFETEQMLAAVEALVAPQWHTNKGYEYETTMEAYAAGRNDLIDKIREVLK